MIIACPECTSPFEVADASIAPLVQVECPTCSFRMILDFAAANDASLREAGMSTAQGFRDESSYRQAVGAGHVSYSGPAAIPAEQGLHAVPEPAATPKPALPVAEQPQPVAVPIERQPERQPELPQAPLPVEEHPVAEAIVELERPVAEPVPEPIMELERPVPEKPPVRHPPTQPRSRPTLIAHTPPPPRPDVAPPAEPALPTYSPQSEAQVETHVGVAPPGPAPLELELEQVGVEVDEFELEVAQPPVEAAPPVRTPPHTPVREPAVTEPEAPRPEPGVTTTKPTAEQPADKRPDTSANEAVDKDASKPGRGRNVFMFIVLILLLAAGGLMVTSMVLTGDPFQLILEKAGMAPPAADNKADGKSDKKSGN